MKLKIFDINNAPKTSPKGRPVLHISSSGMFTVSACMAKKAGLSEGDMVKLAQDETNPKDWFLIITPKDSAGFLLRKKAGASLVFNSAGIASLIFNSVNFKGKSGRILLGADAIMHEEAKLYPLITAALKTPA